MPQNIEIEEIARKNPKVDLQVLEEWRQFRKKLQEHGLLQGNKRDGVIRQARRARISDDPADDPRLVRLQK